MSISELKERIAKADCADRELDGLIAQAFGLIPSDARWETRDAYGLRDDAGWVSGGYGGYKFHDPEPYTASLDAAIALVEMKLPQCWWNVESEQHYDAGTIRTRYIGRIRAHQLPRLHVIASFSTPALALIAALLEALAGSGEK